MSEVDYEDLGRRWAASRKVRVVPATRHRKPKYRIIEDNLPDCVRLEMCSWDYDGPASIPEFASEKEAFDTLGGTLLNIREDVTVLEGPKL